MQRIAVENRLDRDAGETGGAEQVVKTARREELQMLHIEDRRFPSQNLGGKCPAIMADEEEPSARLQGAIRIPADGQRVAQMLDCLKARDETKTLRRKRVGLKHLLANQGTNIRIAAPLIGARDGSTPTTS